MPWVARSTISVAAELLVTGWSPAYCKETFSAAAMNRKGLLKYVQSLLHAVIQDWHHEWISALHRVAWWALTLSGLLTYMLHERALRDLWWSDTYDLWPNDYDIKSPGSVFNDYTRYARGFFVGTFVKDLRDASGDPWWGQASWSVSRLQ